MRLLLGIPVAIITWWLLAFVPFTILSSFFGPHGDVTQGVGACSFFVIGPICAIAALTKCLSIDFDTSHSPPTGVTAALVTVVRLPFVAVAVALWIVVAIPCLAVAVVACYLAIIVFAVASAIVFPFVLFYGALLDHTYIRRYITSLRTTIRQITARAEDMQQSMWDSPRKLFLWCCGR